MGADVLALCLLGGENGIDFFLPRGFLEKAELQQMRNRVQVCFSGPWHVAETLFSRIPAWLQLDLGCGSGS